MAWRWCNPIIFRRYLLLSLLSIAFAYPLCVVLVSNQPTKHTKPVPKWGLTGSMRHLASRFDLQYLMDAGGKQAEIDDTPEDFNGDILLHYTDPERYTENTKLDFRPGHFFLEGDETSKQKRNGNPQPGTAHGPLSVDSNLTIPHIIHQTWEDLMVPGQNAPWIKSWKKNHHNWKYCFWTEHAASWMIHRNFSKYADMYIDYPYAINRADARRYFIMYAYGGVYADLDVESLRPLDELLERYTCIIAQEPREHQVLLYHNKHPNYVMPAFIACRPRHPFFKLVLEMLPRYASKARDLPWNDNIFLSTGPMFLAEVLERYLRERNRTADEYIHLAPSSWFMPTYDSLNDDAFRAQCSKNSTLTPAEQTTCSELKSKSFHNAPSSKSYTTHHWVHSWSSSFLAQGQVAVGDILKDYDFDIVQ